MDREILVYIDLNNESVLVGRLWSRVRKQHESASFEYEKNWLDNPEHFALEPALSLGPGTFHTPASKALFGAIGDSAPDRWGRILMGRAERRRAEKEGKTHRTLFEADYLLQVDDEARQGALRFKTDPKGPFLTSDKESRIPPLIELPRLLSATERVANDKDSDQDLNILLSPGSSLGGARPKASVWNNNRQLSLAKFPYHQDDYDVVLWEAVALSLARKAGVEVPDWEVKKISGKHVLLIRRFDRVDGKHIPFLSAMGMLGANDNEEHSYLEIADVLMQHGAATKADLSQLWRRIVFNILISNTDDHLRNHGFIHDGRKGWRLSPAYDMNPIPVDIRPRALSTAIDFNDTTASIDLAMETSEYYKLKLADAKDIAGEVAQAVSSWRKEAAYLGITESDINRLASAFTHEDMEKALSFV